MKSKQEMMQEIERLRLETVNDLTIKVGSPRWQAAVERCEELRVAMGYKRRKAESKQSYWYTMRKIMEAAQ